MCPTPTAPGGRTTLVERAPRSRIDPDSAHTSAPTKPLPRSPRTRQRSRVACPPAGPGSAILLLLLLLLLWLSASQSGLRALLGLVAELAPDSFRIGQVEGRLLGRIAITDLSIQRPAFGVRIGRLDLDWSPLQALGGILPIHAFLVRDLDVVLGKADAGADDPLVLPDLSIPLCIDVGYALV
jgi:translocation and assembly module TamB